MVKTENICKAGFVSMTEAASDVVEEIMGLKVTADFEQLVKIDEEATCYGELNDNEIIAAIADDDIDDSTSPAPITTTATLNYIKLLRTYH